jgi:tetratricopeptide (TPR) repeat protein
MTVAARDGFGPTRRGALGKGPGLRKLWQVPLLVGGLVAFGIGLRALVKSIRPVPFDRQIAGVEGLVSQEKYAEAINQINILAPYYVKPEEQGELQKLAGDVTYLAQRNQPAPVRENYERIAAHYQKAVAWGLPPTAEMNERWGECALALGDARLAVEKFDAAIAAGDHNDILQRHVRDLVAAYMDSGMPDKALAIVTRMLAESAIPEATDVEGEERRTWGLCKRIEIALGSGNTRELDLAVEGARAALPTMHERDPAGRVLVWIGRVELEKGQVDAAAADLADARRHFAVHHLDDGRAAVLLARIEESHGNLPAAAQLFQEVVVGQAGTTVWPAARLGRAEVAVRQGTLTGEPMLGDYRFVIDTLKETHFPVGRRPEMLSLTAVRFSLQDAYRRAVEADQLDDALAFLALQMETEDRPAAETLYQRATTRERRGDELLAEGENLQGAGKAQRVTQGRALLARSAEDYLQHAELTTLNDEQSGNSKWKAASLLDIAGETDRAIAVYERLTIQRPHDARASEGMLALGRLLESAGRIDKAVAVYERNIRENPTTPAAYTSVVNLARCYAKQAERSDKPEERKALRGKAEQLLLSLVQDSTNLEPVAREFRDSLLSLCQLYYDSGRWGDAILRLDEVTVRYPGDPQIPRITFLLGECYRKSAADIAQALAAGVVEHRSELEKARADRLLTAAGYFSAVIAKLDIEASSPVPSAGRKLSEDEEQYLRASYMDRAECLFQRGDYLQAIKLYDETSARFSDETLAVEAYVQIVNAYLRMNQAPQAAAAAERGQWILQRVPDTAFGNDVAASRDYYRKLLTLK